MHRTHSLTLSVLPVLVLSGAIASCSSKPDVHATAAPHTEGISGPTLADQEPRNLPGLHNVVAYHEGFYSGSVPEGDEGFATIAAMGVKTIISVDGAEPDANAARRHGLRYIHLPIGYNGFDKKREGELVRATRDALATGPVYMHCHHGKHRSAGAAATIAVALGYLSNDEAVARMKVSGTAANYTGLYSCATNACMLPKAQIDAIPPEFPEVSRPQGMVKTMVEIDEINERLKTIEAAGWQTPADHPDLVPVALAGQLADHFRVLAQSEASRSRPPEFGEMLGRSANDAQAIEDGLLAAKPDATALSARFKSLAQDCKACHAKYRD